MAIQHSIRHAIRNRKLIHRRLQRRLIIFPIVALGLLIFVCIDAIEDGVAPMWILIGGLLGLGVGYLVGQIYKIYWREDEQKIVTGIDRMTVLLIAAYVIVRIAGEHVAAQYFHGQELVVLTYSFLAGILLGRILAVYRKVTRVLESRTVLQHLQSIPKRSRK